MFEFLIGLRYIRTKRRNGFVSFISFASIVGITLGVATLIVVLSVMNGFQEDVRNRILGMASHARVLSFGDTLAGWPDLEKQLAKEPHVLAVAPYVSDKALLTNGDRVEGAEIRGIDPAREGSVNDVLAKMKAGKVSDLRPGEFNIIIGSALANNLGLEIGSKLTLVTPQGQVTPAGLLPRMRQFTVVGIFSAGYYPFDSMLGLVHLRDAQKLFRTGEDVSGLRLKLDDLFLARSVCHSIESRYSVRALDWSDENPNFFRAVEIEKRMMFIILSMIVAVAAFNLVSTLIMAVTDKQSDIAILRTLGASPGAIMRIFVIQGSLLGVIGTIAGLVLGLSIALNMDVIFPALEKLLGMHLLPADVYLIGTMPSQVRPNDVIIITGITLLLSIVMTVYPSWRASRTNPAEALRYE